LGRRLARHGGVSAGQFFAMARILLGTGDARIV